LNILSYRIGFATNSSSTHSIIYSAALAQEKELHRRDRDVEDGKFGWNTFEAWSAEAKDRYLVATILSNFAYDQWEIERKPELKQANEAVLRFIKKFFPDEDYSGAYVDHQSRMLIPRSFGKPTPSCSWVTALRTILQTPGVVITGGNDNDDDDEYSGRSRPVNGVPLYILPKDEYRGCCMVSRKDNDWWIVMNQLTGEKMRITFGSIMTGYGITRERAPV
jgi:hypothetical protein